MSSNRTHIRFLIGIVLANAPVTRAHADDWVSGNLVANGDFAKGPLGGLPEGWSVVAPNPFLVPQFKLVKPEERKPALMAAGNGRRECFGYVRHPVHLDGKKTYRLRVRLRSEGLDDLNLHFVHGVFASNFNDGIFNYRKDGEWIVGDRP
jgi:hypothetical protein